MKEENAFANGSPPFCVVLLEEKHTNYFVNKIENVVAFTKTPQENIPLECVGGKKIVFDFKQKQFTNEEIEIVMKNSLPIDVRIEAQHLPLPTLLDINNFSHITRLKVSTYNKQEIQHHFSLQTVIFLLLRTWPSPWQALQG